MRPLKVAKSYDLRFSPDGDRLVTGGRNVALWSVSSRKKLWWCHPFAHPSGFEFSPDGDRVVVKNTAGRIVVLDAADGSVLLDCGNTADGEGSNVLFSPSGEEMVDGSWKGRLTFRSARSGAVVSVEQFPGMIDELHAVPGLGSFITGHEGVGVETPHYLRWSWRAGAEPVERYDRPGDRSAFDRAGTHFAIVSGLPENGVETVTVRDLQRGGVAWKVSTLPDPWPMAMRWSPDGKILAVAASDAVQLFDVATGGLVRSWDLPYASALDFNPDSTLLAMGSWQVGMVVDLRTS